ncbi:MerR family DNA-binding transcriptional regulator [Salipaludibacillus sp. HK11]
MYSIGQLSKIAGCSVRTLRYYDEIALLTPAKFSQGDTAFTMKKN